MATKKEFIAETETLLFGMDVRFRPMMGEYVFYYKDKTIGGVYDGRVLIKDTESVRRLLPAAPLELPYPGAKRMRRLDLSAYTEGEAGRAFLVRLFESVYGELPSSSVRKKVK